MRASTGSTRPAASRGRSSKRCAGRMRGASSSTWHGSTRRRSRSRRSNASMPCSPSSATSTASRRRSAGTFATTTAGHSSPRWRHGCASSTPSSRPRRGRQGHRLQPQPMERPHPFPRRRPAVHVQQRRRTGVALCRGRPSQLDLCRIGRGRAARRRHLHVDRDRQAQRHRPARLARRCARPTPRSSSQADW